MGCDGMRDCVTVVWEVLEIDLYMTRLDSALSSELRAQWTSSVTSVSKGPEAEAGGRRRTERKREREGRREGRGEEKGEERKERERGRKREEKEERKRISTPIAQCLSLRG